MALLLTAIGHVAACFFFFIRRDVISSDVLTTPMRSAEAFVPLSADSTAAVEVIPTLERCTGSGTGSGTGGYGPILGRTAFA